MILVWGGHHYESARHLEEIHDAKRIQRQELDIHELRITDLHGDLQRLNDKERRSLIEWHICHAPYLSGKNVMSFPGPVKLAIEAQYQYETAKTTNALLATSMQGIR